MRKDFEMWPRYTPRPAATPRAPSPRSPSALAAVAVPLFLVPSFRSPQVWQETDNGLISMPRLYGEAQLRVCDLRSMAAPPPAANSRSGSTLTSDFPPPAAGRWGRSPSFHTAVGSKAGSSADLLAQTPPSGTAAPSGKQRLAALPPTPADAPSPPLFSPVSSAHTRKLAASFLTRTATGPSGTEESPAAGLPQHSPRLQAPGSVEMTARKIKAAYVILRVLRIWALSLEIPAGDLIVLRVTVQYASNVPNLDMWATSDPFCLFTIKGRHTNMVKQTAPAKVSKATGHELRAVDGLLDPKWEEHFDCFVRLEPGLKMDVAVLDHETFGESKTMAAATDVALLAPGIEAQWAAKKCVERVIELTPGKAAGKRRDISRGPCTLTLTLEARRVPRHLEEAAKGFQVEAKLFGREGGLPGQAHPAAVAGAGARHVGSLNLRFKLWDGMCDEDPDNSLWSDWEATRGVHGNDPAEEAALFARICEGRE